MTHESPEPQTALAAPAAEVAEQKMVPFMGDDLATALTTTGEIYISLAGMCQALGLTPQPQVRRCQRTTALASALRRIRLDTPAALSGCTACAWINWPSG